MLGGFTVLGSIEMGYMLVGIVLVEAAATLEGSAKAKPFRVILKL
jgi:hypothetical protein